MRDLNNISNQFPVAFGWIFLKRGKNSSWKCQVNLILRWIILCLACKVQYFQEHMWRFRQFWCSLKCTSFFINTNEFSLFLSQDVLYLLWLRRFRNFFFLNYAFYFPYLNKILVFPWPFTWKHTKNFFQEQVRFKDSSPSWILVPSLIISFNCKAFVFTCRYKF